MRREGRPTPQQAAHPNATNTSNDGSRSTHLGARTTERIWVSGLVRDTGTPQSFKDAEQTGLWRADILHTPGERNPYRVTLALRNHYARKFWTVEVRDCATEDDARAAADALLTGRADALRRQARRHKAMQRKAGAR